MRTISFPVLCLAAANCLAANTGVHAVQLSSRDRTEISRVACMEVSLPPAQVITASKESKTSSLILVSVRCGSHRSEGMLPVARLAKCTNGGARWMCETGQDALIVSLPDKQLLTVMPDGMPMSAAAALITEAVTLTIAPFYKPVAPLLMPECTLRQEDRAPFRGATAFKLACTNWNVEVTRDCGVRPCRHFVVRADPKP